MIIILQHIHVSNPWSSIAHWLKPDPWFLPSLHSSVCLNTLFKANVYTFLFSFAPGFRIHSWVYLVSNFWLSLLFTDLVFVLFTDVKIGSFGFNPLYSPRYYMAKNKNSLRYLLGVVSLFVAIPLIQAWPSCCSSLLLC